MYIKNKSLMAAVVSALTTATIAQQQGGQQGQQSQQLQPQIYNGTILQLLNDTSVSPSTKLSEYLYNSSDYQPILDLLNNTDHNVTFFLPSDQVYYEATGDTPPNATTSSSAAGAAPGSARATQTAVGSTTRAIGGFMSSIMGAQTSRPAATTRPPAQTTQAPAPTATQTDIVLPSAAQRDAWFNPLVYYKSSVVNKAASWENATTDATFADQFSYMDLIWYHLVNGSVELTSDNTTLILNSLLTNESVVKVGSNAPLLVQQNMTQTENASAPANWTVGTGLDEGALINRTYQTTNGMVYVINKILVPPVNTTDTLSELNDTSSFTQLLTRANVSLDSQSNFTVFAPTNQALQNSNVTQLDNQTLHNFINAHIIPGIYYTTNVTSGQPVEVQSSGGTNTSLSEVNNNVTVDNYNITQPNILMNNGVLHLIDGVLNYTTAQNNTGGANNTSSTTAAAGATSSASHSSTASRTASNAASSTASGTPAFATGGQTASQTSEGGAFPAPTSLAADTFTLKLTFTIFSSIMVYFALSVF